jgi:uncharacterized membrane protein
MADLIVVTFEDETAAFGLRAALGKLQKDYLIDMEDVVVVTRDDSGTVMLHQATNLTAAGTLGGSFWGLLIGMIVLDPLFGAAAGAGAGALSNRLTDLGIDDTFMKNLGEETPNGGSALFVLVRKFTPDKVLAGLEPFRGRGKALQTSLSKENEQELRDFLKKVVSDEFEPVSAARTDADPTDFPKDRRLPR